MRYLGTICISIIIALGLMGVGYSSWQKSLLAYGTINTGVWTATDYSSVDVSGAPDCTVESQSPQVVTFKIHIKDNNRKAYAGSVVCPALNAGTIPVLIDTVTISKIGPGGPPQGDPLANYLTVTPAGALVESSHVPINSNRFESAGLAFSGNPQKGDYYVTVTFTTKILYK